MLPSFYTFMTPESGPPATLLSGPEAGGRVESFQLRTAKRSLRPKKDRRPTNDGAGGETGRIKPVVLSLILLLPTILSTYPISGSFLHAQIDPSALISSSASLAAFFRRVSPAVVSVEVRGSRDGSYTGAEWRARHPFGASAFFIDERGHLLTAASVVDRAGRIVLTDASGRTYDAGAVAVSPANGVALLRIVRRPEHPIATLPLGKSGAVRVGDRAFTLGTPFGTITRTGQVAFSRGAVTGIYPVRGHGHYYGEVFETDAAVNPGSYGGPLLNEQGEVIGIVLDAFSYVRWSGTALPIDAIESLLPALRARQDPGPGAPGFDCEHRVVERHRARVTRVDPKSAAGRAGLRRGDEIVEFGGAEIVDFGAFLDTLHALPADAIVNMLVLRPVAPPSGDDQLVQLAFKVAPARKTPAAEPAPSRHRGTLGMRFVKGGRAAPVEVEWVDPEGPAGTAGIMPGDILKRIEDKRATRKRMKAVLDARRAGEQVACVFNRDGWEKKITLTLAPRAGAAAGKEGER